MSFVKQFEKTSVVEICPPQQSLKWVNASDFVPKALEILVQNKIYSAPVKDQASGSFLGFIDLVDIVSFIVDIFDDTKLLGENFYAMLQQEIIFGTEYTGAILDMSKRNPFLSLEKNSSLLEGLKLLGEKGIHRVAIVDNGKLVNILSQSSVISWLSKHLKEMGTLGQKKIGELGIGSSNVISVRAEEKTINALKAMETHRVSSVAVVENDGTLLSSLSPKDLKVVAADHGFFNHLYSTTREFVASSRQLEIKEFTNAILCHPNDTLEKVISKLAATRIHRIYVVDNNNRPVSVISLKDIIDLLLRS